MIWNTLTGSSDSSSDTTTQVSSAVITPTPTVLKTQPPTSRRTLTLQSPSHTPSRETYETPYHEDFSWAKCYIIQDDPWNEHHEQDTM